MLHILEEINQMTDFQGLGIGESKTAVAEFFATSSARAAAARATRASGAAAASAITAAVAAASAAASPSSVFAPPAFPRRIHESTGLGVLFSFGERKTTFPFKRVHRKFSQSFDPKDGGFGCVFLKLC